MHCDPLQVPMLQLPGCDQGLPSCGWRTQDAERQHLPSCQQGLPSCVRWHCHPLARHPSIDVAAEHGRSLPLLWLLPPLLTWLRQTLHHPVWPQCSREASAWAHGQQRSQRMALAATTVASIHACSHSEWWATLMASPASPALRLFPGPHPHKLQRERRLTPYEPAPAVSVRDAHGPPLRTMHHHPLPFEQPSPNREGSEQHLSRGIRGTLDAARSIEERLHRETHVCWSAQHRAMSHPTSLTHKHTHRQPTHPHTQKHTHTHTLWREIFCVCA